MKEITLILVFLCGWVMVKAQTLPSKEPLKKLVVNTDSNLITKERQRMLSACRDTAKNQKTHILVLPSSSRKSRQQEAVYIGRIENKPVCKVDLAGVVSKHIGETERNLSLLFEKAASGNQVLFFDEADDLFGKSENPASLMKKIQVLAEKKNVLTIFWCENDCLKWMKTGRVVFVQN